jgi:CelD/BcsL family acetyltransferase involved in cellulose biosynthesis
VSQVSQFKLFQTDPLHDPRWTVFVGRHAQASVFHTAEWLRALAQTYRFQPVVFTLNPPGELLTNGIVCCMINSWLTGRRLVSLPFSDYCEPLANEAAELQTLMLALEHEVTSNNWGYVELRPRSALPSADSAFAPSQSFYLHSIDLRSSTDEIFRRFHKDCVQRKIRRACREGLTCEQGQSRTLLEKFYRLMLVTRRRHELPPPPFAWFENLLECLGKRLAIRVASKDERPIAAVLTLSFNSTIVYKYGCSDDEFHNLGGMPFLFWKTIEDAKQKGAQQLDLGRSDLNSSGLVQFKDRLGATRSTQTYLRFPAGRSQSTSADWQIRAAKRVFSFLPDRCLLEAGRLLYPHIG